MKVMRFYTDAADKLTVYTAGNFENVVVEAEDVTGTSSFPYFRMLLTPYEANKLAVKLITLATICEEEA